MLQDPTSQSLLDRVRDLSDQEAWREFEARYRELILRYGLRRGLSPHDAEDLLQVVLVRLAKRLPEFVYRPEVGRFRAYLRSTVENEIRRFQGRPNSSVGSVEELGLEPGVEDDPNQALWDEEWTLHHFRRAMVLVRGSFPARSLEVFERLLAGASPEELARERGLGVDAIYKVKQRIRARLKECIEAQLHEEEFRERRG